MTPDEFAQARQKLGLRNADLARLLGVAEGRATKTIYDWRHGVYPLDAARVRLLRAYLDGYRPPDWPAAGRSRNTKEE